MAHRCTRTGARTERNAVGKMDLGRRSRRVSQTPAATCVYPDNAVLCEAAPPGYPVKGLCSSGVAASASSNAGQAPGQVDAQFFLLKRTRNPGLE